MLIVLSFDKTQQNIELLFSIILLKYYSFISDKPGMML